MNLKRIGSPFILGFGLLLSVATLAQAQATRTWVSGVGDDANPCSRTAPCKTWAGAISKTAPDGVIDALDPGGFGAVTITKSITIEGQGTLASVLVAGTNGIVIAGTGISVTLRNLDIQGVGSGLTGIAVVDAGNVYVEHVHIQDFTQDGILFAPAGIGTLFVSDTTIRRVGGSGIRVAGSSGAQAVIDGYKAESVAAGVRVDANAIATVRNSHVGNSGEGFQVTAASATMNVESSLTTRNFHGVSASGGGTIRLSNTAVLSNANTGLFNDGISTITSLSGNTISGNISAGSFTGMPVPKE